MVDVPPDALGEVVSVPPEGATDIDVVWRVVHMDHGGAAGIVVAQSVGVGRGSAALAAKGRHLRARSLCRK
jgi:hypothetical protein